jgi:hypothetical protein
MSNIKQGNFGDAIVSFLFLSGINIILLRAFRLCIKGVILQNDKITYTVCIMHIPMFARTIDANNIYDLASELQTIRADDGHMFKTYLINVSGENIQSVIRWSSRSSRDRFLSVMKYKYPHIRVHRFY